MNVVVSCMCEYLQLSSNPISIPAKTQGQKYWNWDEFGLYVSLAIICLWALVSFIFLFVHEYIVIVRKLAPTSIDKLYSYLLPDTEPNYRNKKMAISRLTPLEKEDYRVVIDNLEGEVSKHTNFFKSISFTLRAGECFGIVGHLNAGSVELCRKIGGLDKFSLGEITINGFDISTQRTDAHQFLSISIQQDNINCFMSAYEYLEVLCYCRGIQANKIHGVLSEIFDMLLMTKVMFHSISTFDESYIKKLSFASAFIGKISVMIIDQPTHFLDPISKVAIWNAIIFAKSIGKTIIFSTDSITEAEIISDEAMFLLEGNVVGLSSMTEIRLNSFKGVYIEFRMVIEGGKSAAEIEEKYEKS